MYLKSNLIVAIAWYPTSNRRYLLSDLTSWFPYRNKPAMPPISQVNVATISSTRRDSGVCRYTQVYTQPDPEGTPNFKNVSEYHSFQTESAVSLYLPFILFTLKPIHHVSRSLIAWFLDSSSWPVGQNLDSTPSTQEEFPVYIRLGLNVSSKLKDSVGEYR